MKKDNKRLLRHLAMIGVGFAGCYSTASQAALCEYIIDNQWNSGFVAGIRITNNTTTAINGWEVSWNYSGDNRQTSGWNANFTGNNPYTASDSGWNGTIAPGQKVEFGFQGSKGAGAAEIPTVTGAICGGTPPANLPPVAALTASPTTGTEPLVVAFDASGSTDPDGPASALTYSWNFGDGSNSTETSATPSYTYATAGSYTATVTVSDGTDVDTASAIITVTGTGGGGNKAPVANATADKTRGPAPLVVKFDGSASSDPDMGPMPLSFDWSFGDGTTSTDISPTHTYTANGTYNVTLTVSDGEASDVTNLNIVVADQTARADNPFVGVKYYVDPAWSAKAAAEPGGSAISGFNTAVWMDRIGAITDGIGLRGHLDQALAQNAGMFMFVVYDLPNRDCAALASSGELRISENGFNRYKTEYIAPIVNIISDPKYASINIVAVIEVDSLPNLVTNLSVADCAEADGPGGYRDGIRYALNQLSTIPNVYNYVDIAHSGWLGWSDNFSAAVALIGDVVASTDKGWGSVNGFVSNTSNYTPTVEPFLPDSNLSVGGMPVKSAKFYGYNNYTDEKTFVQDWRNAMIARGAPTTLGMLIDTARNGWGGAGRPTQVSKSTDVDTYVNESKVDRRFHRGNWCNQPGGVGFKPWAAPYEGVDAFVWVKPPGESDGIADPNFTPDPNDPAKRHDPMCDPVANNRYDPSVTTGSMANAPHAGRWFPEQFQLLVANAYPAANEPAGPPPPPAPPRSDCPGLDPLTPVALPAAGVKVTLDLGCKAPIYVSIGAAGANNLYVENSGDAYDVTVDVGGVATPASGYFTSVPLNGATSVKVTRVDAAQSVIVRFD